MAAAVVVATAVAAVATEAVVVDTVVVEAAAAHLAAVGVTAVMVEVAAATAAVAATEGVAGLPPQASGPPRRPTMWIATHGTEADPGRETGVAGMAADTGLPEETAQTTDATLPSDNYTLSFTLDQSSVVQSEGVVITVRISLGNFETYDLGLGLGPRSECLHIAQYIRDCTPVAGTPTPIRSGFQTGRGGTQ